MATDELDALLESAGSGVEGVTSSVSAKEMDRILGTAARGAGFGKTGARAQAGPTPLPPPPRVDDEIGAAFDAMLGESAGEDLDSLPTHVEQGSPRVELHPALFATPPQTSGMGEPSDLDAAWDDADDVPTAELHSWDPPPLHPPPLREQAAAPIMPGPAPPSSADGWAAGGPPSGHAPPAPPPAPSGPGLQGPAVRTSAAPVVADESTYGGASGSSKIGMIAALVMSILTILAITAFLLLRSPGGDEQPNHPKPTETKPLPAPPAPGRVSTAPVSPAEAAARAALWRLAEGVRACTRDVIDTLPGTAPAVPPSFALLKGGVYASSAGDYRSPVYDCTGFRQTEPQAFQIQWQIFKGGTEGMVIAWLDTNADGTADRALGLRVRLVKRSQASIGEHIEVIEPLPAVSR